MKNYSEFINNLKKINNLNQDPLDYVLQNKLIQYNDKSLILEFGVYHGNTINNISNYISDIPVFGFDSFEGLPEKWERTDNMNFFDKGFFSRNGILPNVNKNVMLIKGWFNETLPEFIKNNNKPVSFIHIDCDLYSSTKCIFENLKEYISNDCIFVFDELVNYGGYENGELKAFYEFVTENNIIFEYIGMNGSIGNVGGQYEKVALRIINNPKFKF